MTMTVRDLQKKQSSRMVTNFSHRHTKIHWRKDWDPTEPTATRPLAFTDHAGEAPATYFYTHDLTKNVCELLNTTGTIITTYDYTPFGSVTASNTTTPNPFMFSSEILDPETSLVYYNFRHYNSLDGRWISRDPIEEQGGVNGYVFVTNKLFNLSDILGAIGFGNIMWIINSAIPKQVILFSFSQRLWVFPVPVMPIVTIEAYLNFSADVVECCKSDKSIGYMASVSAGIEISGGVGTSIGGNSGVKAHTNEKTKSGSTMTRYRNTEGRGYVRKKPVGKEGRSSDKMTGATSLEREPCPKDGSEFKLTISVGISGFVSTGAGWFSMGAKFDTKFGECVIPGKCEFKNPIKEGNARVATGMGTGIRIAIFGRSEGNFNLTLY